MKKVLLSICGLLLCGAAHAASPMTIIPSTGTYIYKVTVSSSVATLIRPANLQRKGIEITTENYNIRITTYANTNTSYGYPINTGSPFSDNIEASRALYYGISTGAGSATVWVIEKTGPISQ